MALQVRESVNKGEMKEIVNDIEKRGSELESILLYANTNFMIYEKIPSPDVISVLRNSWGHLGEEEGHL
jgi:hypothetical protein